MHIIQYYTSLTLLVSCGLSAMNNNPKVLAVRNAGSYKAYLIAQISELQGPAQYFIRKQLQDYVNVEANERKTKYEEYQKLKKEVADAAHYLNPALSGCYGFVTGGMLFTVLMEYTFPKPHVLEGFCVGAVLGILASTPIMILGLLNENTRNPWNIIRKHPSLYVKSHNKFDPYLFGSIFAMSGMTLGVARIILLNKFPFTLNFPFLHK